MIAFMFLSLVLLIVVIWLIAPALLGKRSINQDDTDSQNAAIAKERLAELELALEQGDISQQAFEQTQAEIEKSLLQDVHDGELKVTITPKTERNAFVIITAIPLMALALYWLWGSPDSINLAGQAQQQAASNPHNSGNDLAPSADPKKHVGSVDEMAALLEKKLLEKPDNPNGWYTLGRTYMSLKQYDKAVVAFKRLRQLVGDDVTVLVTLADALTMASGGQIIGEPFELIKKALALKPDDPTALWLGGLGYEETGDAKTAVKLWKKLLPLIASEPRSVHQVQSLIAAAEKKMGIEPTVVVGEPVKGAPQQAVSNASIQVTVKLDDAYKNKVSASDFVLVYARAANGPRMPLAIVRKQVKDLPMTFTLDDSMAMQPSMKLSNFEKVNIIARISKLGQAMPQSGDVQGQFGPVTVKDAKPVTVVIDRLVSLSAQKPVVQPKNPISATSAASIKVKVQLDDALISKVSPDDYVLVYARAANGPRMPLAIVRKQVRDLPMTLTLDDSMAMRPSMKLSSFDKVDILARVTKSGQAMPQSGDKQGQFGPVVVKDAKPVTVVINKVLP